MEKMRATNSPQFDSSATANLNQTRHRPAKAWSDLFQNLKQNPTPEYFEPTNQNGQIIVEPPDEVIELGVKRWDNYLIGKIVGKMPDLKAIHATANALWGKRW